MTLQHFCHWCQAVRSFYCFECLTCGEVMRDLEEVQEENDLESWLPIAGSPLS